MQKTLPIGSTFLALAEKDLGFSLKMLEKQFSKPVSVKTNGTEKVSTNGYNSISGGKVNWDKQDNIRTGKANDQFEGQVRGSVVAGAGKKNNKKNK